MSTQPTYAELQTRISNALFEYHRGEDPFTRAASTVKQAAALHVELAIDGNLTQRLALAARDAYRDSFCNGTGYKPDGLVEGIATWVAFAIREGS